MSDPRRPGLAWIPLTLMAACTGAVSHSSSVEPGVGPSTGTAPTVIPVGPAPGPPADAGHGSVPEVPPIEEPEPSTPTQPTTPPAVQPEPEPVLEPVPLEWRTANLTWFESYPDPGSEECIVYNGCQWSGYFAGLDGQQPYEWVAANNIAAVHSRDFDTYGGRTLRMRSEVGAEIDVVVYDLCSDTDCSGCCSRNASETGFLIDLEVHTAERFGQWGGVVEWACVDC